MLKFIYSPFPENIFQGLYRSCHATSDREPPEPQSNEDKKVNKTCITDAPTDLLQNMFNFFFEAIPISYYTVFLFSVPTLESGNF
jgi:hypothetical protein